MKDGRVLVSVVSHAQGDLVASLLDDLNRSCTTPLGVVVTINIPEVLSFSSSDFKFPLRLVHNSRPRGFGANHNAAFWSSKSPFFCVANPDVRLASDPFPALMKAFDGERVAIAGPLVRAPNGRVEDSARRFPTPYSLARKLFVPPQGPEYPIDGGLIEVDWVAGMFMLFGREAYAELGGFDERYFLYYEDIDLCARMRMRGMRVVLDPGACVVHDARRASHRNPRHAWWHLRSILRFFTTPGYLRLQEYAAPPRRAGE